MRPRTKTSATSSQASCAPGPTTVPKLCWVEDQPWPQSLHTVFSSSCTVQQLGQRQLQCSHVSKVQVSTVWPSGLGTGKGSTSHMSLLNSELCKQKINENKWVCAMGWLWAFCQAGWAVNLGARLTQLPHALPEAGRKGLYSRTDSFYSTFLKDISPMIKISSGRGFAFLERSHFRSGGKRDHKGKKQHVFPLSSLA